MSSFTVFGTVPPTGRRFRKLSPDQQCGMQIAHSVGTAPPLSPASRREPPAADGAEGANRCRELIDLAQGKLIKSKFRMLLTATA